MATTTPTPQDVPKQDSHLVLTKENVKQYESLIKYFNKEGLKQKDTVLINRRAQYFRNDNFIEFVGEHKHGIMKILKNWEFKDSLDTQEGAKKFINDLMKLRIMVRLERIPGDQKYKWPKRLNLCKTQIQDDGGFYTFILQPKQSRVWTFLLIGIIVIICLFQVWPLWLKIGIFYVSVVLLYVIIGTIILRLILFSVLRIFGVDFWLLPNLFADVGPLESLVPIVSASKCTDNMVGYFMRFGGLVALAYFMYLVSEDPTIVTGYADTSTQTFDDMIEWGKNKLAGPMDEANRGRKPGDDLREHLENLLKEEELEKKKEEEAAAEKEKKFQEQQAEDEKRYEEKEYVEDEPAATKEKNDDTATADNNQDDGNDDDGKPMYDD